jgi:formamidopyrimidine-DNA glycosylase
VDTLRPAVLGRRIVSVDLIRADILSPSDLDLAEQLTGQIIAAVSRRGKRIVIDLGDGNRFYIHLGMTGRLTMEPADAQVLAHTHLIIDFENSIPTRNKQPPTNHLHFRDPRRFGGIWWLGHEPADENMGPEPLGLRVNQLAKQLAKTTRAIKNALLDQSVVAGLGNIYVDESLFKAGIYPLVPASELSREQIAKLNRAIKFTLRKAISHRGSTLRDYFDTSGSPGGFQKMHTVYDRAGLPCRKCRTPIKRIVMGGRSTHFCPNCQPER